MQDAAARADRLSRTKALYLGNFGVEPAPEAWDEGQNGAGPSQQPATVAAAAPPTEIGGGRRRDADQPLVVAFKNADGRILQYKMKPDITFDEVFAHYSQTTGKALRALRFHTRDGRQLRRDHTPRSFEIEDRDTIDVMDEILAC